jgi:hypothetical protein
MSTHEIDIGSVNLGIDTEKDSDLRSPHEASVDGYAKDHTWGQCVAGATQQI